MMEKFSVLCVDDEIGNLDALERIFRSKYNVLRAESGPAALELLSHTAESLAVIITDQKMPEMTGVDFLERSMKSHPETVRILLTGYTDIQALIDAVNKGQIYRYMNKPWNEEELKMFVTQAYEVFELRKENKVLTQSLMQANKQLEFMLRQKLLS